MNLGIQVRRIAQSETKTKGGIDNSIPPFDVYLQSVLVTSVTVSVPVFKTLTEVLLIQCSAT